MANTHILTRLDNNNVPDDMREIRLFAVVRNEVDRLPYFLEYYRKLGVSRFFFTDNNSNDGSREYLLTQSDCHVYFTDDSYAEAVYGIHWNKKMLDTHGTGHWCLSMDADELLVYPHCETVGLQELCRFLQEEGSETMFTFLLDMYPKDGIKDAICEKGKPFQQITPYFDKDYAFVDRISLKPGGKLFPQKEVIGGPRTRCFYEDQGADNKWKRLFMHVVERGIVALKKVKIPVPYIRLKATPLFKVPMVKWKKGNAYTASTHQMNTVPISTVTGAILHFKFFSDFHERAVKAVTEGQHAEGAIEYKKYLELMDNIGNLVYPGTTYYESSKSLLDCGLIKTSASYEAFVNRLLKNAA